MGRWIGSVVDNALNFAWHLAGASGVLALAALAVRRRVIALVATVATAIFGAVIVRSSRYRVGVDPGRACVLRVMTLNAYNRGTAIEERVAAFAREHAIDVLLLQEWDVPAGATLGALDASFPYHAVEAPDGTQIYARVPFRVRGLHRSDESPHQETMIEAVFEAAGATLTCIAVHPLQPVHPERFMARRHEFQRLAEIVGRTDGPVLVAGDCNASILSPDFQALLGRSGLRSVSLWPPAATWPAPLGRWGIAIDHVLLRGLTATSFEVGPSLGSDHRAVVVGVAPEGQNFGS